MNLKGKRVLLTGATGGLGTIVMKLLRTQGCRVIGIDKNSAGDGGESDLIRADIRVLAETRSAVTEAVTRLGGLDILINNAGVLELQDPGAIPAADATELLDVNLLGAWRITAAALPALLESRGRVINVSSLFAVVNAPFIPAYSASKRALVAFSDTLRMQYWGKISVTTVYPGYMRTPIHIDVERQGLSVERLVTFKWRDRKVFSLEDPLDAAARGILRACSGRPSSDRALTFLGGATLFAARHFPRLVDAFIRWRVTQLTRAGLLHVELSQPPISG